MDIGDEERPDTANFAILTFTIVTGLIQQDDSVLRLWAWSMAQGANGIVTMYRPSAD